MRRAFRAGHASLEGLKSDELGRVTVVVSLKHGLRAFF